MSARRLAIALSSYLESRECPELNQLDRPSVVAELDALRQARDEILHELHSNPQLADEPLFVNAREYLLDEACCEAGQSSEADVGGESRLEGLRKHLRREAREFIASGCPKSNRLPARAVRPWAMPSENLNGPCILVAVDGSQQAGWAVTCAQRLARLMCGSIMLVHVVPVRPPGSDGFDSIAVGDEQASSQIFARARRVLSPELEVNEIVRQGNAANAILRTAEEWRADLIVMGTHGRGRVARFLLGSVAEAVLRRATCPVVTVAHQPEQEIWRAAKVDLTVDSYANI